MKPLKPNRLLHTTVLSFLLAATMGVSACSSEKEGDNAQSGDATGTNQSSDVDTSSSEGDAPLTGNDSNSNIGAGEGSGTSANSEVNTTNPSGSTDNMGNSGPDTNINSDRDENPNLDQTPADGVQ